MTETNPFQALAGEWRGSGTGSYPTIESFDYTEELVVEPVPGRPVAHWRSRTRDATTGEPRHAESGFLRSTPEGVELVVAHSFGIVETATGTFDGTTLEVTSTAMQQTPSAKQVDHVSRRYELDASSRSGGAANLTYTVAMAAVGVALTHHLAGTLTHPGDC